MTDTNNKKETFESEFAMTEQAILMAIERNLLIEIGNQRTSSRDWISKRFIIRTMQRM